MDLQAPRRKVLIAMFAGGCITPFGCCWASRHLKEATRLDESRALAERLIGLFNSPYSALALGHRSLEQQADKGQPWLSLTFPRATEKTEADLKHRLRAQIQQDFETGRTVLLDGWIVAETEAQVCALLARTCP